MAAAMLIVASGCKQAPAPARPIGCFGQFYDSKIDHLLDRSSGDNRSEDLTGIKVVFEVLASDRPVKSFEALLARFGHNNELNVAKEGARWRIRVAPSSLYVTSQGLSSALEDACAVASKNEAQIVRWEYILPRVSLDDGLLHTPPPS